MFLDTIIYVDGMEVMIKYTGSENVPTTTCHTLLKKIVRAVGCWGETGWAVGFGAIE